MKKALVTGSAGHLGEGLMRTLGDGARGIDIKASPFTQVLGSITDRDRVREAMAGCDVVYHTATLHKPHVVTHSVSDFIETNVRGTAILLEEAVRAGIECFVFTSTTSAFGDALVPPAGEPAAWITEDVTPVPKNIYGATKTAAEDLCRLFHRNEGLNVIVLRTSRFFPEEDDNRERRDGWEQDNVKANEFLFRRLDLADCVEAHLRAAARVAEIGFGRYIVSATTPFTPDDLAELRQNAPSVLARRVPEYADVYGQLGWRMFDSIDRVYVNERARQALGWQPSYDFGRILEMVEAGDPPSSELARAVGKKGYHDEVFDDGPFPVREDRRDECA